MRRADIEVPNLAVDVDSRARSACYPRGSFYPLSPGPSTRCQRITKPHFRACSACLPRSQAPICLCALWVVSIHPEGTIGRLRYSLGGDRPSQTTPLALSRCRLYGQRLDASPRKSGISLVASSAPTSTLSNGSHLSYADAASRPDQAVVKLHGVFLSCRG